MTDYSNCFISLFIRSLIRDFSATDKNIILIKLLDGRRKKLLD
jgi:hypothetical protein